MIDPQGIATILSALGIPAVIAYLTRQLVRRHNGNLVRAASFDRTDTINTRLYDYIDTLRADATAAGLTPRPWPRGLKPKE